MEVNETRCNHITFYRTSCCKPSILAVEKFGRNAFNGRTVLAGGICVCSWNRVSEKVVRKDPGVQLRRDPMDVVIHEYYVLII